MMKESNGEAAEATEEGKKQHEEVEKKQQKKEQKQLAIGKGEEATEEEAKG